MKNTVVRFFAVLLTILTVFYTFPMNVAAASGARHTVRVGFFPFDGYHMVNSDGQRSGYGYEYLQNMLHYTNWDLKYVGYEENASWSDMQQMLADGRIDLLTSAVKTAEREKLFDFSNDPIGTSSAILTVKAGNEKYLAGDYSHWNGIRTGLLVNNSRNDSFDSFAKQHGFSYTPLYFDSTEALTSALSSGKVDAVVTSNLRRISNEWILEQFDPKPFYVIVKKGNKTLLDEVNYAISQTSSVRPGLASELFKEYYSVENSSQIAFTAEERAFISKCKNDGVTFNAVIDPARKPYSYYENGNIKGILADMCREIFSRTGLSINIANMSSRNEYLKESADGNASIVCDMNHYFSQAEDMGYVLSDPYYDGTIALLYRKSFRGTAKTAGLVKETPVADYMRSNIEEGVSIKFFDTIQECADAVLNGTVDEAYLYTNAAQSVVYDDETNSLSCVVLPNKALQFSIGVKKSENYLLVSVIEKALLSISNGDKLSLASPYTLSASKPQTLKGLLYDQPILIVGIVVIAFMLLFMLFASIILKKRQLATAKTNAILKDAVEAAQHANEAKSRFLSQMSHEIRTPLNAIVGLTAIAHNHEHEPALIDDYLGKIDSSSKVLLNIINDVLDMSAIEGGKLKIASVEFDLKSVLNNISAIYYPQCSQKGINFVMVSDITDETVVGDSMRVNQILLNLVSNAFKFTDRGGEIKVAATETSNGGDTVFIKFTVSDTGIGMSEEMVGRLFKPFEQESATTARKYGGSGLGMSITENLISLMHGSIHVRSEKGVGTEFTVQLPFRCVNGAKHRPSASFSDINALIVDDEKDAREYTGVLLDRLGVSYDVAISGEDALEKMAKNGCRYDVCFIDWKMPGMSGAELTKKIRVLYGGNTVVLIISAYELSEIEPEAKDAGADMFVPKPLFQSTVFNLLMSLSNGGRTRSADAASFDFTGHRVLVADDNELNREVTGGLLNLVHMEYDFATDGQEAVDIFTSSPAGRYDAILMDVQMPVMDGHEATRAIRASSHPDAASIPIYAMTANAFTEDISAALACGMDGHIAKPIDSMALYERLSVILKR